MSFRLTYATMFNPPEAMHERFDAALATVVGTLGRTHALYIDGEETAGAALASRSEPHRPRPSARRIRAGGPAAGRSRRGAPRAPLPGMREPPRGRARDCPGRVADVMEARVYEIAPR
jgi:1-pyrroline-5-carboxylate dehydrogenase